MIKLKGAVNYLALAAIQALLSVAGFITFWKYPKGTIFCNRLDGLKNMFNLVKFVSEPVGPGGIFKFNSLCYPFGEYVYYTDNTPLFSVPFRFFCQHVHDISAYTTVCFNLFVISNIIACSLLVYHVFRLLLNERMFSFIMAIILPWTSMAILRLPEGHFNLSFTSLMLIAIYLVMLWHRHRENRKKQVRVLVCMCAFTFVAFLMHGYYLAIIGMFIGAMLFIYGFAARRESVGKFTMICSGIYFICSVSMVLSLLGATDKYLSIRKENAMGYDNMDQKIRFSSLFTHYPFSNIHFPVSSQRISNEAEQAGYMSNIGLFLVAGFLVAMLVSAPSRRKLLDMQKTFFNDRLLSSILLGSIVLLFVSFGENYETAYYPEGYKVTNILNPLTYLHHLSHRVEQFRSLERFVFPFYFAFYIWVTYMLIMLLKDAGKKARIAIWVAVIFLGGAELRDNIVFLSLGTSCENVLDSHAVSKLKLPKADFHTYQAILPIPYYCVGSEDYDHTIDVDDDWSRYNYQLSLATNLPSMAYVLSRVPPAHNISLLRCIANDTLDASMQAGLSAKPVLVAFNKKMVADSNMACVPKKGYTVEYYWNICQFPARHHLVPIDSAGNVVFYNWYPKGNGEQPSDMKF